MLTPEEITAVAYRALEDKKAKDVKILKTAEHTVLADYFVICNGSSSTHIRPWSTRSTSSSPKPGSRRSAGKASGRTSGS